MNSQELLKLVKNCPKGAETLVTRCLHSLTDKGTRNLCRAICQAFSSSSGDAWRLLGPLTQVVWAPELLKATRFSLRSSSVSRAGETSSRSLQQKAPGRPIPYPCPQRLGKGALWVLAGGIFKVPVSLLYLAATICSSCCHFPQHMQGWPLSLSVSLERGDPGVAQTHQAESHRGEGGF